LYADDELAHDIHSLTLDSRGRVVVSGPGYVRILLDSDGDGRADRFQQFADGPATGSQGMYFHGSSLLCAGDGGLLLYRDENSDDRADGVPQVFLKIAAGGEHHVHSIQRGPDGWWYVMAGNFAGVTSAYATAATSPIRQPVSGTLLRLSPELRGGEIVADGFRNAYDFAFSGAGDFFTYDSDDERDISLPWVCDCRSEASSDVSRHATGAGLIWSWFTDGRGVLSA
jgi:glucose/arabinose dehydrogenase